MPESDLEEGKLRMLEVDNRVIFPEMPRTKIFVYHGNQYQLVFIDYPELFMYENTIHAMEGSSGSNNPPAGNSPSGGSVGNTGPGDNSGSDRNRDVFFDRPDYTQYTERRQEEILEEKMAHARGVLEVATNDSLSDRQKVVQLGGPSSNLLSDSYIRRFIVTEKLVAYSTLNISGSSSSAYVKLEALYSTTVLLDAMFDRHVADDISNNR